MKEIEDQLDRVDTASKRKNLIFDEVQEGEGGKEEVGKSFGISLIKLKQREAWTSTASTGLETSTSNDPMT